jgi:hypothetical protein
MERAYILTVKIPELAVSVPEDLLQQGIKNL